MEDEKFPFEERLSKYRSPELVETRTYETLYAVVRYPRVIVSKDFVECLGVALYDPKSRTLGFTHIGQYSSPDRTLDEMIGDMKRRGASVRRMEAKLNGELWDGGNPPSWASKSVKAFLKTKKIPVVAEYLNKGAQDIIAHSATGKVEIYMYPEDEHRIFLCSPPVEITFI